LLCQANFTAIIKSRSLIKQENWIIPELKIQVMAKEEEEKLVESKN
jgi:SLT domain-containing protein